ncbi:MAG TPA: hypothetical protein VF310_02160 [Vicinamibacteria bacterium]
MTQQTLILVIAAAVVLLATLGWLAWSSARTRSLRRHFGPEYERAVETAGDRRKAERELAARQRRVDKLHLKPLPEDQRARYLEGWQTVQSRFVDQPRDAVVEADRLVGEVMNDCGYPMEDFDQRAADVSVDHPHVVTHYRAAHQVATRDAKFPPSTEELRTALLHYRALFEDLLAAPVSPAPARG